MRGRKETSRVMRHGGAKRLAKPFFTLVELLVVIAIISILACLLLPSLQGARKMAQRSACMSNMRQCGMGTISYAGDFNEFTIAPENWVVGSYCAAMQRTWADMLMFNGYLPSAGATPIYYSDSCVSSGISVSQTRFPNIFSCPILRPPSTHQFSGQTFTNGNGSSYLAYGVRSALYSTESAPAKLPKLITLRTNVPYIADTYISAPQGAPAGEQGQGMYLNTDYSTWAEQSGGVIQLRHNRTANAWFPDGHVASLTYNQVVSFKNKWNLPWYCVYAP